MGDYVHFSSFLGENTFYIENWNLDWYIAYNFSVYLMYRLILPETSPLFTCPNIFAEQLFPVFIVLGKYNFELSKADWEDAVCIIDECKAKHCHISD